MTAIVEDRFHCSLALICTVKRPIRAVAFNTSEHWSEDVSEDVAREIQRRCDLQLTDVPSHLQEFVDRHAAQDTRQFSLQLV